MYKNKMSFIQPLPFSLKKAKELVNKHKSNICSCKNAFTLNKEIIYHTKDEIELEKTKFTTHLFFNEKMSKLDNSCRFGPLYRIQPLC